MEHRLRVVTNLPNSALGEVRAFRAFLEHIQDHKAVEGFSRIDRVEGYWLDASKQWVRDRITLIVTDLKAARTPDGTPVDEIISSLKTFAHSSYEGNDCKQDEIWITSSPISVH